MPRTVPEIPERSGVQMAVDLRLTTRHLEQLSPAQVQAVFHGVGHLTALTVASIPEETADA